MISLTVGLYASFVLTTGVLMALALHNRKMGWRKSRTTLLEAMDDLYADLGLSVNTEDRVPLQQSVPVKLQRLEDPADFSLQLIKLRSALGEANSVSAQSATNSPERQLVPARPR